MCCGCVCNLLWKIISAVITLLFVVAVILLILWAVGVIFLPDDNTASQQATRLMGGGEYRPL